jgi:hypothetical protein
MVPKARTLFLQEMEECIRLVASTEDADPYRKAQLRCSPLVLQTEADPIRFLEFCNYNPWKASKRMIEYWKFRFELFGPDRFWKRVLDTTGTQALSRGAARIIGEGHLAYLVPPDQHGRTVLFASLDQAEMKFLAECHSEDRKEAFFYELQLIASQNRSPKNEFIIAQVRLSSDYKFFPEMLQVFTRGSQSCLPVTCKGLHVICAPKDTESIKQRFIKKLLPFIWKLMEIVAPHAERRTLDFVTWTNKAEQHEKVTDILTNKFGLQPDALPAIAGGKWNYTCFLQSNMAPPITLCENNNNIISITTSDIDDSDSNNKNKGESSSSLNLFNLNQLSNMHIVLE